MLSKQRQNLIVQMIRDTGSVQVKELSSHFSVTPDSIRKDLTLLQKKGLLRKTYGGAVAVPEENQDRYVAQRKGKYMADKQKIARRALGLLRDGDVVFLDISTVNIELAKMLRTAGISVTVVTNMIEVMLAMSEDEHNKLLFIGGTFSEGRGGFTGAVTNRQIAQYRFDVALLGVVGVDAERNAVMTYTADDAATKAVVLAQSRRSYMLLEARKLERGASCIYARLEDFEGAVVNAPLPEAQQEKMAEHGVKLLIS